MSAGSRPPGPAPAAATPSLLTVRHRRAAPARPRSGPGRRHQNGGGSSSASERSAPPPPGACAVPPAAPLSPEGGRGARARRSQPSPTKAARSRLFIHLFIMTVWF